MNEKPYGYVYKITNKINGKNYIGQHKYNGNETWRSYMGSGRIIKIALHKYGKENFTKTLIEWCHSKEQLDMQEKLHINEYRSMQEAHYNVSSHDGEFPPTFYQELNKYPIWEWYSNGEKTMEDIAVELSLSQPTIHRYISTLKVSKGQIDGIRRGRGLKRRPNPKESRERARKTAQSKNEKIRCTICNKSYSIYGIKIHEKTCAEKAKCLTCQAPLKNSQAKYCYEHAILSNGKKRKMMSDDGKILVQEAGIMAAHQRWHVKRGLFNEKCKLCIKDNS